MNSNLGAFNCGVFGIKFLSRCQHFLFLFYKYRFYLKMAVKIVVMRSGFAIWEAEKLSRTSDSHNDCYEIR
jgi:hypothetical protein